jgi:hypothetical protein
MTRRVRVVVDGLGDFVEKAVRKLQLRAFQTLTSATPVDTGFARAGWTPSVGAPDPGPSERPSDPAVARSQAAALFGAHVQISQGLASSYRLSQGAVFIVNNVRYVGFLNAGTSAQAPALFVERAVATAVAATRREIPGQ